MNKGTSTIPLKNILPDKSTKCNDDTTGAKAFIKLVNKIVN